MSQKVFALFQGSTIRGSTNQGITVCRIKNESDIIMLVINLCISVIFQCRQAPIRQCGNVPREQCTQIPRYNCKKVSRFSFFAYQIAKKRCLDFYGPSDILSLFQGQTRRISFIFFL